MKFALPQGPKTRRIAELEEELESAHYSARSSRTAHDRLLAQMSAATEMLRPPPTTTTSAGPLLAESPVINGWQKV